MPVGIFRPWTNTDAVNPGGRTMDGGNCGLKNAVLLMHCGEVEGFDTVAAAAAVGNARSGANAHAAEKACKRFSSMIKGSSLPLDRDKRGTFVLNRQVEIVQLVGGSRIDQHPQTDERPEKRRISSLRRFIGRSQITFNA
jgi:hypothetical protein